MRTEQKMMDMILGIAKADECIRAVSMESSRANPATPKDKYQDYDITFYVSDMAPFYKNPAWVIEKFGEPLIMQMPEATVYHIKLPTPLFYYSCCNNFWWCLNNVAKGIAWDELPYVMRMLNDVVRSELHDMIRWYTLSPYFCSKMPIAPDDFASFTVIS